MEQVQNHWTVEEEEEELQDATALEGRENLQQRKDRVIVNGVIPPPSSSSSTSNGHTDDVPSASVEEESLVPKEEEPLILKEDEDEPAIQKDEEAEGIGNFVENGSNLNDDSAPVGLGLVAEFVGDATKGEAVNTTATINVAASQNTNSVYFDKQEGNEVNGLNEVHNGDSTTSVLPKSHGEGEFDIQVKSSDVQNSLRNEVNTQCMKTVDDKVAFSSELSPVQNSSKVQATTVEDFGEESSSAKAGPNLIKEIDQQLKEFDVEAVLAKQETHDLFCPKCKSCITKRVILKKRKKTPHNTDTIAKLPKHPKPYSELVNSSAYAANQDGHATTTSDVLPADKPDNNLANGSGHEVNQGGRATAVPLEPPTNNDETERDPQLFRCLSCFSFFIPIRNGFKLFPKFGDAREPETLQDPLISPASNLEIPSNVAASNANWFISLITKQGKKASEQGVASVKNSKSGASEQHHSSSVPTNMLTSPVNGNLEGQPADGAINKDVKPTPNIRPEHGGVNSLIPSTVKAVTIEPGIENGIKSSIASWHEPLADQQKSSDMMNELLKYGTEHLVTENVKTDVGDKKNDSVDMIKTEMSSMSCSDVVVSKSDSVLLANGATTEMHFNAGKPSINANLKSYEGPVVLDKSPKDVDKTPKIPPNIDSTLMHEARSFGSAVVVNDIASNKQGSEVVTEVPSYQDFKNVPVDIEEEISSSVSKENKEAVKSSTPQTSDIAAVEGTIVTEAHTEIDIGEEPRAEIGEPKGWEILKSIVYGGLVESITSLGIVSSAAGSGAAPLSIIAMGFANLIGGLFIIFHNLIELKNDHTGGDTQQMNAQKDRYQELLGRRSNFLLHAFVAVLSFLIFGCVPIVIYCLLISKNYYPEVKLAAVAATSIVCIILLAIGKVYTTRPRKTYIKTVLHYVTLAFAAAGVSYIAGELINRLLKKISGSESGFVLSMPSSDTSVEPAWISY